MAAYCKNNALLSRVRHLLTLQKPKHFSGEMRVKEQGQIDKSKWRKLDSRNLGISRSMIPDSLWIVLKVLRSEGHEAYLVGGCVRDLILKRVPKDFDVITTAALKQVKQHFHRSFIVGIRFPICRVHVRGSVIEVSSFDTVAKHNKEKEIVPIPRGCDMKDYSRWRNCMLRDFTINSLFFDPFESKIYDYANAMMDLRSLKLRTLIPAHLSFEEDCARILRGLRLAARLGLSVSRETEIAIQKLVPSIASLPQSRIMMEMNYMFSYGASGPSLSILQKFKLLEILLPLHAAYLNQQSRNHQSSVMLMKLFHNLDKLVTCGQPSDCNLWVGLLAFHLALIINPQDALVVWTFASVFYHGNWKQGVKFGREHADRSSAFVPEITNVNHLIADDELAVRVTQLASAVQHYTGCLSHSDNLLRLMAIFPDSPCSGLVFVPYKSQRRASDLFNVLVHDIESYGKERKCSDIDYRLLGQGHMCETRFVLGKIIIDTMRSGSVQGSGDAEEKHKLVSFDPKNKETKETHELVSSDSKFEFAVFGNENRKRGLPPHMAEPQKDAKKKRLILENYSVFEDVSTVKRNRAVNTDFHTLPKLKLHLIEKNKNGIRNTLAIVKDQEHPKIENAIRQDRSEAKLKPVKNAKKVIFVVEKINLPLDKNNKQEKGTENSEGGEDKIEKPEEDVNKDKNRWPSLSSIVQLVKDGEHPNIENITPQDKSEAKSKPVKKNFKKVTSSAEKTNSPLEKNKKQEKNSENNGRGEGKIEKPLGKNKKPENNGGGEGKTEKLEEDVNMDKRPSLSTVIQIIKVEEQPNIENVKRQDRSEAKRKLGKKNVKKVDLVEKTTGLLDKNSKREKVSENNEGGKGKNKKPEEDANRSEVKMEPVKEKFKQVTSSVEKANLPLGKNKKRHKVSENNRGEKGKTEKPEDVNKDKHRQPSLSSMLPLVEDGEHPKIERLEQQDRSEMKLEPVEKKIYYSVENTNSSYKNREEVSENNGGGEGKAEKPKEDRSRDKHKQPSLSSLFKRY